MFYLKINSFFFLLQFFFFAATKMFFRFWLGLPSKMCKKKKKMKKMYVCANVCKRMNVEYDMKWHWLDGKVPLFSSVMFFFSFLSFIWLQVDVRNAKRWENKTDALDAECWKTQGNATIILRKMYQTNLGFGTSG